MRIFGKERDLDGIFKNWSVVYGEWERLMVNAEYIQQIKRFQRSKWFTTDWQAHKLHTATNLLKEGVVLCPRTTTYSIILLVGTILLLAFR
jgi:hypothetical protein